MKILLIGGNGFVGKSLINAAAEYNIDISYLSRNKIPSPDFSNINWIKGDIFDIDNILIAEKFDIAVHLVGTIKNKKLYNKLNTQSLLQSIELCNRFNIAKLVYFSAQGGFTDYFNSKKEAENFITTSNLDYLIVRPGLMYGSNRPSSYFNVLPIKLFSLLGISFFKNVYPLPVEKVTKKVLTTLITSPLKKELNIVDLK